MFAEDVLICYTHKLELCFVQIGSLKDRQLNVKYFVDNQNLTHPKMDEFLSKCAKTQHYSKNTLKNPNRGNS